MTIVCVDNTPIMLQSLKENADKAYPYADVFVHSVAFIQEVAEHLVSAELYVPEFVPELRWHTLDRASHHPTLGNLMTLQAFPSGSSGPLRPVGKALLNRSMASSRMDSCTWR